METIDIAGTYRAQWGEGPIWWKHTLLYVDIENHTLIRFNPATGEEQTWNVQNSVGRLGTVVPRAAGGMLLAGDHGIHTLDPLTGKTAPVADPETAKPHNRFNDGKCSPDGRFFAGTISLDKITGNAALYRLDPDLTLHHSTGSTRTSLSTPPTPV